MTDWELEIEKIVNLVLTEGRETESQYASSLYKKVREMVLKEDYPDRVEEKQNIVSMPQLVAFKKLPAKFTDAWGNEIDEDSYVVAKAEIENISAEWVGYSFPITKEEAMNRKYPFIAITPEEHDKIIKILEKYIQLDINDSKGTPLLLAMYPIGMRSDSPNEKWNRVAEEMRHNAWLLWAKKERERLKDFYRGKIDFWGIADFEFINRDKFAEVHDARSAAVWYVDNVDYETCEASQMRVIMKNGAKVEGGYRYVMWILSGATENMMYELEKYEIEHGKKPILTLTDRNTGKTMDIYIRGNKIRVPKNAKGYVIGKGGKNIKAIEKWLGKKIKVEGFSYGGFERADILLHGSYSGLNRLMPVEPDRETADRFEMEMKLLRELVNKSPSLEAEFKLYVNKRIDELIDKTHELVEEYGEEDMEM